MSWTSLTSVLSFCTLNHPYFLNVPCIFVSVCFSWCGPSQGTAYSTSAGYSILEKNQYSLVLQDLVHGRLDYYPTNIHCFSLHLHGGMFFLSSWLWASPCDWLWPMHVSTHDMSKGLKCACMLGLVSFMPIFCHDNQVQGGPKCMEQTWTKYMAWSEAYISLDKIRVPAQQTSSHRDENLTNTYCSTLRLLQCLLCSSRCQMHSFQGLLPFILWVLLPQIPPVVQLLKSHYYTILWLSDWRAYILH